jgi:hypothetical protein
MALDYMNKHSPLKENHPTSKTKLFRYIEFEGVKYHVVGANKPFTTMKIADGKLYLDGKLAKIIEKYA